jgi:hypothetical protein
MVTGRISALRVSLSAAQPPAGLGIPLTGLWWAAKEEWDKAHAVVQGDGSDEAAWVHAYLHRVEGDQSNAAYWYRRAGRDPPSAPLDAEWAEIAASLLGVGG